MKDDLRLFILDAGDKYPSDSPLKVEINAERVLAMLPKSTIECTRDCIQIDCGGKEGIVILVTPETIELRLPTIEWTKSVS